MPSIDDLKTDKGMPTLTQGETVQGDPTALNKATKAKQPQKPKRAVDRPISPGVTQGPSTNKIVPQGGAKGMIIQKANGTSDERVEAKIDMPATSPEDDAVGINRRESIVKDVFGKGGPFDQYVREKTEEFRRDMDKLDADRESAQYEDPNKPAEAASATSESEEDEEVDSETTINQNVKYHAVDIMKKPKENKMEPKVNVENEELEEVLDVEGEETLEPEEEYIEEEAVEEVVEPEPEPAPAPAPKKKVAKANPNPQPKPQPKVVEEDPYATDNDYDEASGEEPMEDGEELVGLEYAKPETAADTYTEAIEVESVTEEEVPLDPVQPKEEKKPQKDSIDKRINKITRSFMALPVEDDEDDNNVATVDDDEDYNILKNLVKEKIAPISEKLDLKSFTIVKKGTTSNNILQGEAAIAKWVLPNTGVTIQMREISGSNLENMRALLDRRPADNRGALKIMYDHVVSPKPKSFEAWLKSISFNDLNHLFMCVYISSFADSNYIPKDCTNPSCAKPFLTDNISIMDMVKFTDAESEKKFWDIYNSDIIESKGLYTTEVVPISKSFAVAYKDPSLYDVIVESAYYNDQFMERYSQAIQYVPFIDAMYYIDYNNHTLIPVEYETYDNNIGRSARSKVQRYDKVINTLNADENAIIAAYIRKINEKTEWLTYQIPETTCPHCGATVPAVGDQEAAGLVFLRNRLALLATS